ncbi:MAG: MMPL family transporter [Gemmatales bacterium]|nr:MMPL family transporter [Gemmatales bacterium]MDW7995697.1 MMPL family transporter [Gemmatales bacterium]
MSQHIGSESQGWLSRGLTKLRLPIFLLGIALLVLAYRYLELYPVTYNRSMESFFPATDERLQLYKLSRQWFPSEHSLLVVYRDTELWTPEGMARQLRLQRELESCAGVSRVLALASSPCPTNPFLNIAEAVKQASSAADLEAIRKQVQATRLYAGVTLARDGLTTALLVQLHRDLGSPEEAGQKLEAIRRVARQTLEAEQAATVLGPFTAGTLLMIHDVYEYTSQDGRRLQFYSVLLMALVIAGAFILPELRRFWERLRCGQATALAGLLDLIASVRWLLLPFLVIYSTLTWAEAIWSFLRGEMTMVGSAISSLVAVISVVTVVHLGLHYRELRSRLDSQTALQQTLHYLGPAIFWMLLTTAGGFGALLVCEIKPVYDFGMIMLLATLFVGVAATLFFPLTAMGWHHRAAPRGHLEPIAHYGLIRSLQILDRRPLLCGGLLLVPGVALALGMGQLQPQTDFTNNFRKETEVYRAYRFIEDSYGGAGQLELIVETPDLFSLSNDELRGFLAKVRTLQDRLTNLRIQTEQGEIVPGISKALSITDFYDFLDNLPVVNKFLTPRVRLFFLAGDVRAARKELGLLATAVPGNLWKSVEKYSVLSTFWNREERKLRVILLARERLSTWAKRDLLKQIHQCCGEELGQTKYWLTGIYLMLANLIENVLRDQAYTTLISLGCMFGMAMCAFRSWKLASIAMLPTVLPVIAVVGTMGWIGLPVNIATAMLASVAMGMTIDSSVLYLYRLREEQWRGASFAQALLRTHCGTGTALLVASCALVLGFSVLTVSRFIPLVHFGLLAALALLGGVIGNLILLPLLLRATHRPAWQELSQIIWGRDLVISVTSDANSGNSA